MLQLAVASDELFSYCNFLCTFSGQRGSVFILAQYNGGPTLARRDLHVYLFSINFLRTKTYPFSELVDFCRYDVFFFLVMKSIL